MQVAIASDSLLPACGVSQALRFGLGSSSRRSTDLSPAAVGQMPAGMHDTSEELAKPLSADEVSSSRCNRQLSQLPVIPGNGCQE